MGRKCRQEIGTACVLRLCSDTLLQINYKWGYALWGGKSSGENRVFSNWYSEEWNEGVTPRNAHLILRWRQRSAISWADTARWSRLRTAQTSNTLLWKAVQRWMVRSIGRGSIKFSWQECGWLPLTKTRMKVSRRKNGRNAVATKVVCVRSSKAVAMKNLAVLQASPSTLAKRAA